MILDLVDHRDPILRQASLPFDFDDPPVDPIELSANMIATMIAHNGMGLSAVQVGIPYRAIALNADPTSVIFNPRIVDVSEATTELEEGCLSLPGLLLDITRPSIIKVRFSVADGETRTVKLSGMTSRVVQHEISHLDGRLITDEVSKLKLHLAIKKANKKGFSYSLHELLGSSLT